MNANGDIHMGSRRNLLTIGLRSILLLVTLSACLVALRNSRIERQQKTAKVNQLKKSIGEIVIEDRNLYGLVEDSRTNFRGPATLEWQVYFPSGATYELCWNGELKEDMLREKVLPSATRRVLLQPGYHILRMFALKGESTWRVVLAVDANDYAICDLEGSVDREEIAMKDSILRNQQVDMLTGQDLPYQQAIDRPLEVFRGAVVEGNSEEAPAGVVAIWIEAKNAE